MVRESGSPGACEAQLHLGWLYDDLGGVGVLRDYTMARQWYEKAAEQGNAEAQFNLGTLYRFGAGGPKNNVRAYMWFTLAAEHYEDEDFQRVKPEEFRKDVTPAQMAEAQKMAREWKPKGN